MIRRGSGRISLEFDRQKGARRPKMGCRPISRGRLGLPGRIRDVACIVVPYFRDMCPDAISWQFTY